MNDFLPNPKAFFDGVRSLVAEGNHLTEDQVDGCNSLIATWAVNYAATHPDVRWLAYALATVWWETDWTMQPIPEQGHGGARPYNKPDPDTGQTYYGRGYVQLTWKDNYAKQGSKLNVDLVNKPDLALDPTVAGRILFGGMIDGDFTGHKLSAYFTPTIEAPVNARHIINGTDKAFTVAALYRAFGRALVSGRSVA